MTEALIITAVWMLLSYLIASVVSITDAMKNGRYNDELFIQTFIFWEFYFLIQGVIIIFALALYILIPLSLLTKWIYGLTKRDSVVESVDTEELF